MVTLVFILLRYPGADMENIIDLHVPVERLIPCDHFKDTLHVFVVEHVISSLDLK